MSTSSGIMCKREKPHIVVLGAGFGGLYLYKNIKKQITADQATITLIDKHNHFLFTPFLPEIAAGGQPPSNITESVRRYLRKGDHFMEAEVTKVDFKNQLVNTSEGKVAYDYLVVALGSTTQFYGVPGAKEHALVMKTLADAITFRNFVIEQFEAASLQPTLTKRRHLLNFAIIGGGPTGVELACELSDYIHHSIAKMYPNIDTRAEVTLHMISASCDFLKGYHPAHQDRALRALELRHYQIHKGSRVVKITPETVELMDGAIIPINHVVWCGGVKPISFMTKDDISINANGRIEVEKTLQTTSYKNVFALGDMAMCRDEDDQPLPMLAQVAVQQGQHLAKNFGKLFNGQPLEDFKFNKKGKLAALGEGDAVVDIKGMRFTGWFAYAVWRMVYLIIFQSWQKRMQIILASVQNIARPREVTKLED